MKSDVVRELQEADWHAIGRELAAHALAKIQEYGWRTGNTRDIVGGMDAEAIAHEAIARVFNERRRFDPARGKLVPYLKGIVDSMVSHLARGAENRHEESIELRQHQDDGGDGLSAEDPAGYEAMRPGATSSQERVAGPERALIGPDGLIGALFEAVEGERDLTEFLEVAMVTGETTAQPLAAELKTTEVDINNRIRKLRRRAASIRRGGEGKRGPGRRD